MPTNSIFSLGLLNVKHGVLVGEEIFSKVIWGAGGYVWLGGMLVFWLAGNEKSGNDSEVKQLTKEEKRVIEEKGTEAPYSGEYENWFAPGVYKCKRCGAVLYQSKDKFDAKCGWPAFDEEVPGAVKRLPDADGLRTEVQCAKCGAHLGHVFEGEGMTAKNVRHCVNSLALEFELDAAIKK